MYFQSQTGIYAQNKFICQKIQSTEFLNSVPASKSDSRLHNFVSFVFKVPQTELVAGG